MIYIPVLPAAAVSAVVVAVILTWSTIKVDSVSHSVALGHPLDTLRHKSGWVSLGVLDTNSGRWATVLRFRIVDATAGRQPILPEVGDTILTTEPLTVYVRGYKKVGEVDYLMPPGPPVTAEDRTGIEIPSGTRAVILDLIHAEPVKNAQRVWARVGPV